MDQHHSDSLVGRAASLDVKSTRIHEDLASALFPKSDILLSDRMISNGRQYLRNIVAEIEAEICLIAVQKLGVTHPHIVEIGNSKNAHSYRLLEKAGVFEEKQLLDQVFVQVQMRELNARLLQKVSQEELERSLTRYLDSENASVADAAMGLLVAQSRANTDPNSAQIADLPAHILHQLTWSVVAALRKLSGYTGRHIAHAAEEMLAGHDEGVSVLNLARRLSNMLDQGREDNGIPHPVKDGLPVFIARIAKRCGLTADQITVFTAEPNMVRLVVIMRALNIPVVDAISIFAALGGSGNILTAASYNELGKEESASFLEKWAMDPVYQDAERKLAAGFAD